MPCWQRAGRWLILGATAAGKTQKNGCAAGGICAGKIYYGIKTGLNEAFVIDAATRERLIAEDERSGEVIKPFLAGRDVKRYVAPKVKNYVFIPWHFPLHRDSSISGVSEEAEQLFQKDYPAVYQHLLQFKEKLEKRNKDETGVRYEWYALQRHAASYWEEFEKEKILFPDIALKMEATISTEGEFCGNTIYFIPSSDLKLLGFLCSKLVLYFYSNITSSIRGGYLRFIRQYLEQIPVPTGLNESAELEILVDKLIQTRRGELEGNISEIEKEIDRVVFELFGLGDGEILTIVG